MVIPKKDALFKTRLKFQTGKPGNFNSLREVGNLNYIMSLLP